MISSIDELSNGLIYWNLLSLKAVISCLCKFVKNINNTQISRRFWCQSMENLEYIESYKLSKWFLVSSFPCESGSGDL